MPSCSQSRSEQSKRLTSKPATLQSVARGLGWLGDRARAECEVTSSLQLPASSGLARDVGRDRDDATSHLHLLFFLSVGCRARHALLWLLAEALLVAFLQSRLDATGAQIDSWGSTTGTALRGGGPKRRRGCWSLRAWTGSRLVARCSLRVGARPGRWGITQHRAQTAAGMGMDGYG